ncbi:DUF1828 domain-containing protein [Polyangium spumosum]|uniref:DUF1828 domain-containing protein n=1 Tax=Polyangium spumosum TaxID=889282 RepID=A0A6N7Q5F9_9BACT|nr:DUF1828 domain-containing protein [Polyangium spumosum]MRG98110.1 DUF1828 domain-containing protein [Polyangium spumosum]
MNIEPCRLVAEQLGALFVCTPHDAYIRMRTPLLYPDGDVIDIFVRPQGNRMLVTDLGESLRWLRTQTASASRRSPKQQTMIQDVCQTHGIELFKGMLVLRDVEPTRLAEAVLRLGQAASRVGDLWFTMRTRTAQSVTDEVEDLLRANDLPFERGRKMRGGSGRDYNVDFEVHAPKHLSLVQVLSTGSRAATAGLVEHTYTLWSELAYHKAPGNPMKFVSLLDDTVDVWAREDFRLLETVSDQIVMWSRPDAVVQALVA